MQPNRRPLRRRAQFESIEERLPFDAAAAFCAPAPPTRLAASLPVDPARLEPWDHEHPATALADSQLTSHAVPPPLEPQTTSADVAAGIQAIHQQYGFQGLGQTVVVIDSGIAWDHVALGGSLGTEGRVVGGWDFAESDADPYDDGPAGYHGTHVAGIIASSDSQYTGFAPQVDLVALRVFDDYGNGSFARVEQALQWVLDHLDAFPNPITTVNLSVGTRYNGDQPPAWGTLEDELQRLNQAGVFVTSAAGNNFSSFGVPGVGYPAASPYVVPAASLDVDGALSSFSQRSSQALAAPGQRVISTVPQHLYPTDPTPNDFAPASGTSMSAPHLAGAAVLVREAMTFVGHTEITAAAIYQQLLATADQIYDPVTDAQYPVLNVQRAIETLMADDFGSLPHTARHLGGLADGATLAGTIEQVADRDYFTFTATADGPTTISAATTHRLALDWQFQGDAELAANGIRFDAVAGQTYLFSLGTKAGIGHYQLVVDAPHDGPATSSPPPSSAQPAPQPPEDPQTPPALVSQAGDVVTVRTPAGADTVQVGTHPHATWVRINDAYHQFDARLQLRVLADGQDTVTIFGQSAAAHELTASPTGTRVHGGVHDVEITGAGSYHVRDAAAFDRVTLIGTAGDDVLQFAAALTQFHAGALSLELDAPQRLEVRGGGGHDRAELQFPGDGTRWRAEPALSHFSNGGTQIWLHDVALISVTASGGFTNQVVYLDSPGDDQFSVRASESQFVGPGFRWHAVGFGSSVAHSRGGTDEATYYGTAGDDRYSSRPKDSWLVSSNFRGYGRGFTRTFAFGGGGSDQAAIAGTAGDDQLTVTARTTTLRSGTREQAVNGFAEVRVDARQGGFDQATVYDTPGDDRAILGRQYAHLTADAAYWHLLGFQQTYVLATSGGNDQVILQDSPGNDQLTLKGTTAWMSGQGFYNYVYGFDQVRSYAMAGGADAVELPLASDDVRYREGDVTHWMIAEDFVNFARGFEQAVMSAALSVTRAQAHRPVQQNSHDQVHTQAVDWNHDLAVPWDASWPDHRD